MLATIMLADDPDYAIVSELSKIVSPSDFYREQNAWIYDACLKAWKAGDPTTVPCIARYMLIEGTLDPAGAEPYLVEITTRFTIDIGFVVAMYDEHAAPHARLIRNYARQRREFGRAVRRVQEVASGETRYNTVDVS